MIIHYEHGPGAFRWPTGVPLPDGIVDGERPYELERFPNVRGLAVETRTLDDSVSWKPTLSYEVYGDRWLLDAKEVGFQLEGRVDVAGRRRSAFTGSILVVKRDNETGTDKRYHFAVLHVRREKTQ